MLQSKASGKGYRIGDEVLGCRNTYFHSASRAPGRGGAGRGGVASIAGRSKSAFSLKVRRTSAGAAVRCLF